MFTGIIKHLGTFKGYHKGKEELVLEAPSLEGKLETGESLAVNGVCLTLIKKEKSAFFFNLSSETREQTTLGSLRQGEALNLELPLSLQTPLGGHLVTGHVDGTGKILRSSVRPGSRRLTVSFPRELRPYFISKGSVALNGVSLTVASLGPSSFDVELIPLTLKETTLGSLKVGERVNLESDIIGKYVYNWVLKTDSYSK